MKIIKSIKKEVSQRIDIPQEGMAEVKRFGKSGAHIVVPNAWIGKQVKVSLLPAVIALAAILSLSVFAYAYAISSSDDNGDTTKARIVDKVAPKVNCQCVQVAKAPSGNDNNNKAGGDRGDSIQHKIDKIDRLFRSNSNNNNMPVIIQPLDFATVNGTTTANVTMPVCNGVVGGPCLDPTNHAIVP